MWVAVVAVVLLWPRHYFIQMRTGWVTVATIREEFPEGTMCPMAIQENMRGLPLPALMSYGSNGCSAPDKRINLIGLPVDLLVAYGIVYGVFAYQKRKNG